MKESVLSRREQAKLKKLLAEYHKLGDEIYRCKERRAQLADEIVRLISPFKVGDRILPPKPTRFSTGPKGVCEVIEVFAIRYACDINDTLNRPDYKLRVKKVLKNGNLSQRTYTAHWPDFWKIVE